MKLRISTNLRKSLLSCMATVAVILASANSTALGNRYDVPVADNFYAGEFYLSFMIQDGAEPTNDVLHYYYGNLGNYTHQINGFVLNSTESGGVTNITLSLNRADNITSTTLNNEVTLTGVQNSSTFKDASDNAYALETGKVYIIKYKGGSNGSAAADLLLDGAVVASFSGGSHNMSNSVEGYMNVGFNNAYSAPDLNWAATTADEAKVNYTSTNAWNYENDGAVVNAPLYQCVDITFGSGDNLYKTATFEENVYVGAVTVNDDYTFTSSDISKGIDASSITIADEKKLTLDGNGSLKAREASGKLYIAKGDSWKMMITQNASNLNVTGDGEYKIIAKGHTHNTNFGDEWTGKVNFELGTVEYGELDLTKFGNANSTIELKQFKGYFTNSTDGTKEIVSDIILTNGNWAGVELINGYAGCTYKFSGDISGSGNFKVSKTGLTQPMNVVFSGDVSKWTGNDTTALMVVGAGTHNITYTGDATTIKNGRIGADKYTIDNETYYATANVTFDHEKAVTVNSQLGGDGVVNITVKNTDAAGTKFTSSTINIDSLEVGANTLASFTGVNTLTLADVELMNGAELSVGATGTGSITNVTMAVLGANAKVNGNLSLSDGASLTLNGYDANAAVISGTLTLGPGITLNEALMSAILGLEEDASITLFQGLTDITLSSAGVAAVDAAPIVNVDASTYFSGLEQGAYYLNFNEGTLTISAIPEPATATLSLLALAGLAARRRRR